jgi:hypothetical protein
MELVRAEFPSLPTTQPMAVPLELNQAARLILKDRIYLSKERGDLWITRSDAAPTPQVLKEAVNPDAADTQVHLLREHVAFVHWSVTSLGNAVPYLICKSDRGGYELVSADRRTPLPANRDYRWDRAFTWDNERVVVPSPAGVSIFQFRPDLKESYRELMTSPTTAPATEPSNHSDPQALLDGNGVLAWVPFDHGTPGSRGAVRYLDGRWNDLGPDQSWPEKIVQLVPLRDGTVFQFVANDDGTVAVQTSPLERGEVDAKEIEKIVAQLSDEDSDVRRKAVSELANFGPGAWPVLTKLAEDQPPQAQLLLRQLLKDKNRPTLSGMTLLGDRALQLATRLSDSGAVFYAPQGVSVLEPNGETSTAAPAWISVRPGHFIDLLPAALVVDLKPDQCKVYVLGDQWIANTDVRGPRLFYGNGFATLLRKDERQFSEVIGMDQRGRWLFKKPGIGEDQTLVIDPHLPDPTPRLPVWNLAIAETVGWDKDNWPVVQNGSAFALAESDWRGLEKGEKFSTHAEETPPTTFPSTAPTSQAATAPADAPDQGHPILTTPEGTRYFDGLTRIKVTQPGHGPIDWPLPPAANGTGPVSLVVTKSGKLFLFNQPGRVLRIAPTPGASEPFRLEATFTHNIPSITKPTRVWLDPAGRIDIAWENRLAILFPEGYIPRAISEKMLDQGGLDADSF